MSSSLSHHCNCCFSKQDDGERSLHYNSRGEPFHTFTCFSSCESLDLQQTTFTSLKQISVLSLSLHKLCRSTVTTLCATCVFFYSADVAVQADIFCFVVTMEGLELLEMNGYWKQWWHSSNKSKVALYHCHCQSLSPFSSALLNKEPFMLRCNHKCVVMSMFVCVRLCVFVESPNIFMHLCQISFMYCEGDC